MLSMMPTPGRSNRDLDWFERCVSPFLPCHLTMGLPVTCGKLGMSLEGVGNRRVFAIGNFVKQRLLYPLRESIHIIVVGYD